MDHFVKLQQSLDALFGTGSSKYLPKDIDIILSRKTGRIRTVSHKGKLLCTLRINGSLAISIDFAQTLLQNKTFRDNCIEINKDAAPFVMEGRSVFCKHVVWCGKNVRVSSDTPILFGNQVIAVGKAILSSEMISDFKRGVAIKVRDSFKKSEGGDSGMMRGGNREMRRMMDKMGLDMNELQNVQEVIIKTDKKEIIISKPSVTEMKAKDSSIFTVTADSYEEAELEVPIFSDEDIQLVSQQAGVDEEKAKSALEEAKGDLARAILLLTTG